MTRDAREIAKVVSDAVKATLLQVNLAHCDINRVAAAIGANAAQVLAADEDDSKCAIGCEHTFRCT